MVIPGHMDVLGLPYGDPLGGWATRLGGAIPYRHYSNVKAHAKSM